MAKYKNKNTIPKNKVRSRVIAGILIAILAVGIVLVLERTNVINLYEKRSKPIPTAEEKGINEIDYSPADPSDNDEIEAKKDSGEIDQTPNYPTQDTAVQVTYIASDQGGISGGPLEVKFILNGITSGNCLLVLSKGSQTLSKNAAVIQQNNTFTCDGFNIPYAELSNGEWQSVIKVTSDNGRNNEASTQITIN